MNTRLRRALTLAARTTTAGLQGGMTSPVRPWFRLGLNDLDMSKYRPSESGLTS